MERESNCAYLLEGHRGDMPAPDTSWSRQQHERRCDEQLADALRSSMQSAPHDADIPLDAFQVEPWMPPIASPSLRYQYLDGLADDRLGCSGLLPQGWDRGRRRSRSSCGQSQVRRAAPLASQRKAPDRSEKGVNGGQQEDRMLYLHAPDQGRIRTLQRSVVTTDSVTRQLFSEKFLAVTDGVLSFIPEVESVVQNLASRHSLQPADLEDMKAHAIEVTLRGLKTYRPYVADPLLWVKRAVRSGCLNWLRDARLRVPVEQLEAWAVEAGVDLDALEDRDEEGRSRIAQLRDHIPPAYLPPLLLSGFGDEDIDWIGTPVTTSACGSGSITVWEQLDSLRTLWTRLDDRQRQIGRLSERDLDEGGMEDVEIARRLGIGVRTVERCRAKMRDKAGELLGEVVG